MPRYTIVDGVHRQMTAEEEAHFDSLATKDFELSLDYVRQRRTKLLAETDYWTLSDTAEMSDAQRTYRQNLRDITNGITTLTDIENLVWPTKP